MIKTKVSCLGWTEGVEQSSPLTMMRRGDGHYCYQFSRLNIAHSRLALQRKQVVALCPGSIFDFFNFEDTALTIMKKTQLEMEFFP